MSKEIKAIIFNKVQGSFVDGHGVRTTIFLKGCPLVCKWCCNPEGQSFELELKVTEEKCDGCGRCEEKCPRYALTIIDGRVQLDRKRCNVCGQCADFCFTGALEPFGRYYTVEEMFEFLKKDMPFYRSSGGGITIGGGEATWQPDFVLPLIKKCHDAGIHVAIDTCGYVSDERGVQVLVDADLILFDIKGIDPEHHKENTGVSNELIWKNLRLLGEIGKPVIIRLPIIPGYTDSEENLRLTAEKMREISSIIRVDILPVHQFGKVKYEQIGKKYLIDQNLAISEERQQEIKKFFEKYGFTTQIGG
jgi:pyruvate formate lyase activating enzyme